MDNKDKNQELVPEFTLEDIMREFGSGTLEWDESTDSLGDTQVFQPITEADLQAQQAAAPAEEEAPVAEEIPAEEAAPIEEESPVEEDAPVEEEAPAEEEAPVEDEAPVEEETPTDEEVPAEDESPTEEEIPAVDESPVEEEIPAEDEIPAEEEAPVEDEAPVEEEIPAEEEAPAEDEVPAEDESPVEEEIPTDEESPAEEPAPMDPALAATQVFTPVTVEDLLTEEEAPAEEEEVPAEEGEASAEEEASEEASAEEAEAEEEAPAGEEPEEKEYVLTAAQIPTPKPLLFRSKLSELKRQLVAGPEKRYYDLSEIGLGRVQIAIFLNLLVVALCTGGTVLYAMGAVMENRLRLMVFSQILAMMVSALLGCYVLMDGIVDLFTGKFSLNSMLFLTLAACTADAVFCLQELRVPCCAAFSLEMCFALWDRSLRRSTEMGQMDTLRKANRLDALVKVPEYFAEESGIVRTEGRLEDFMDNYNATTTPEKVLKIYSLVSILVSAAIAVLAGMRHDLSLAIQVFATSMLVAVPAGAFVSQSRPAAILERRLHMVGTVLCGWQGVKALCGNASFPLTDRDIFPLGSVKLNGVKFLGDTEPDIAIAAATALMRANGGGLEPVFTQLLKSRNGFVYSPEEVEILPEGVSGMVKGHKCLLGLAECLTEQGIEIPEEARVNQAVYFAVDGRLTAVFALNYARTKASAGGLVTLGSYRKIRPMVLADNFMINAQLLKDKFGIKTKRYDFPDRDLRADLAAFQPNPQLVAGALTSQQNLSSAAYAVTGARALRTASRLGLVIYMAAGILGLLIMAALAYLGSTQLLSPLNILLYQLVWLVPGLLFTEWTRTV